MLSLEFRATLKHINEAGEKHYGCYAPDYSIEEQNRIRTIVGIGWAEHIKDINKVVITPMGSKALIALELYDKYEAPPKNIEDMTDDIFYTLKKLREFGDDGKTRLTANHHDWSIFSKSGIGRERVYMGELSLADGDYGYFLTEKGHKDLDAYQRYHRFSEV